MARKVLYGCVCFVSVAVAVVYLFTFVDLGHVQKTVRHAVSSISHMRIVFDSEDNREESTSEEVPLKFHHTFRNESNNRLSTTMSPSSTSHITGKSHSTLMWDAIVTPVLPSGTTDTSTTANRKPPSPRTSGSVSTLKNTDVYRHVSKPPKKHLAGKEVLQKAYNRQVNLYSWSSPFGGPEGVCIPLRTMPSPEPTICTFNQYEDKVISRAIQENGTWEAKIMWDFRLALLRDSDLNLVDLGANLGVYTLTAARLGREVLAVEPCHRAVDNLHRSVVANKYESKIKLLVNAIAKDRGLYKMRYDPGFICNATIEKIPPNEVYLEDIRTFNAVPSITLDDIVPYIDFKKAILKIDISGSEKDIMVHSEEFFRTLEIPYIFMHWENVHLMLNAGELVSYLLQKGYLPKNSVSSNTLDLHDFRYWNSTIIWIKSSLINNAIV